MTLAVPPLTRRGFLAATGLGMATALAGATAAELRSTLAAKPGLTAVALTAYDNQLWSARPEQFPGLRRLGQLGLRLVSPASPAATDVNLGTLPAVRARQFAPWRKLEDRSHAAYTADVEAVTAAARTADPDLAP